jgi:hypothetical protein
MRKARAIKVAMVAIVLLIGGGALALARFDRKDGDFHGAPVPALFSDGQLGAVHAQLLRAESDGHRAARAWLDAHPVTTDAEFAKWAVQAVGPPPGAAATSAELAQLKVIAAQRTPQGTTAAVWLEQHGKKQPWKAIRNQTETFYPRSVEQETKQAMGDALDFGKTIENSAKARFDRPSPYVKDPSLSSGGVRVDVGGAHQSYPSSHMVDAGIGSDFLRALDPHLRSEYDWMADEVAYSRLYTGGHYLSDITRGMFLGTLIGDYRLREAGLAPG